MVEKENPTILSHYIVKCPCCGEEIAVPQYRCQPITLKEYRRLTREEIAETKRKLP